MLALRNSVTMRDTRNGRNLSPLSESVTQARAKLSFSARACVTLLLFLLRGIIGLISPLR